jgi:hypothetical protein
MNQLSLVTRASAFGKNRTSSFVVLPIVVLVLWKHWSRAMTVNSALVAEKFDEHEVPEILRCFSVRSQTRFRSGIAIALLLLAIGLPATPLAKTPPSLVQRDSSVDTVTRHCKNIAIASKLSKGIKKNGKKNLGETGAGTAEACLEVRFTALEIQEYLQAYGREQKWNLIDEHVAEDAWTFTRMLGKDELLRFTKKEATTDGVVWTSGMAFLQVKTTDLADGFVHVEISALFRGYGQNPDRFAPPKESWPLHSNATLENHIISVLETHFKKA